MKAAMIIGLLIVAMLVVMATRPWIVIPSTPDITELFPHVAEEHADELARSPLIASLPADRQEANLEFGRRISESFPDGSSAAGIIAALTAAGFEPPPSFGSGTHTELRLKSGTSSEPKDVRVRRRRNGPCITTWRVGWSTDDRQQISNLFTDYDQFCV